MKKNHPESPWKYIGLIGSIGLELLFLVVAGAYVGRKLDERFQSEPFFLAVGIFGGMAGGIISAVFTIRRLMRNL
ncbi:MAG: AtpZ/AtpI family protein [Planifilum fimeticola]